MSLYLLMGVLPLVLQVGCAVHALKTGRSCYWLWFILLFPAAGALVYFFVEVLPELRHGSAFDNATSGLTRAIYPERELSRLKDQLEVCDSHANRVALAQEYLRLGKYDDAALKEYESQLGSATGQEAKCRYALLLKKLGQNEKANALFEQILKAVARSPRYYRKTQSKWVEIAGKSLAEKCGKDGTNAPQG